MFSAPHWQYKWQQAINCNVQFPALLRWAYPTRPFLPIKLRKLVILLFYLRCPFVGWRMFVGVHRPDRGENGLRKVKVALPYALCPLPTYTFSCAKITRQGLICSRYWKEGMRYVR